MGRPIAWGFNRVAGIEEFLPTRNFGGSDDGLPHKQKNNALLHDRIVIVC